MESLAVTEDMLTKTIHFQILVGLYTNLERSTLQHRTIQLLENGNLIVSDKNKGQGRVKIFWRSFSNPINIFLPSMRMDESLVVT
ncbi:D-mannose-binding lectin protein [Medicago truncatula]|uniref:D-mannose-binding lectin protein n=1 Tax=Medicago truncatula TaxID=3880 RepID=G7IV85_MEDTR|nr:D-mannose-binding lectin protein [Medicago truncatula]